MRWALVALCACSLTEPPPTIVVDSLHTRAVTPDGDAPAFTLTASDGSGLVLVRVQARAVIEGPLAFTELHLHFANPENRVREGTFAITLPSRAAISRFAMAEGDKMKEAEVVPKALARRAYEDFLHRGIDPALLEKAAGNQFTARVFPIPARATKHLVVSYSSELANEGYVLPLRGLPKIDDVSITLATRRADGTRHVQTLQEKAWYPDRDFVASVSTVPAVGHGTLVAAAFDVAPDGPAVADPPSALTLFVDTSGARAAGFTRYLRKLHALVGELARANPSLTVAVIAFDQETRAVYRGPATKFGDRELAALAQRGAAGASDFGQLAPLARGRVAILTDGVITAGSAPVLRAERVDVILAGGIRDDRTARSLVRSGTRSGDVFDFDREPLAAIAAGLGSVIHHDVPIEVAGAAWFYPRTLPSLRAGTQVAVFARLAAPLTMLQVQIGDRVHAAPIAPGTPALVERAVARTLIEELEDQHAAQPTAELSAEIEKLSVASRVVSSQTTMLVLDTEDDYARYQIDRKALADILVIGPNGLEHAKRTFVASATPAPKPQHVEVSYPMSFRASGTTVDPAARQRAIEEARNAGLLGSTSRSSNGGFASLTGTADVSSGFGAGAGGMRSRTADPVPTVSIGVPMAMGSLDKNIIRRYIKRHLAKVTYCYEKELLRRPTLDGTVVVTFSIGKGGKVTSSTATGMDPTVATCVAGVIRAIEFPTVDEDVRVNYPFTFRTANSTSSDDVPTEPARITRPTYDGPPAVDPTLVVQGDLARVLRAIATKRTADALAIAKDWRTAQPGDVLAWVALGEAYEAIGDRALAARAYGSIIDVHSSRADFRRFAGERLERVGDAGRALAIDTYRRAIADRPDQVTGHRLLAFALLRANDHAGAFAAIMDGVKQAEAKSLSVQRVLVEDAAMIATAYMARGGNRELVLAKLERIQPRTQPVTRFVLYWETDANDVDLHIRDAKGNEAWYANRNLASGGELHDDITTGYGPEVFEIRGKPTAGPYDVSVHYFSQGAMGYGMGLLQIVRFDGTSFTFEDRPYVIMQDRAHVALGKVR